MKKIEEAIKEIINAARKLKIMGFLPGFSGNISLKLEDKVFITPSGVDKGELKEKDISVLAMDGKFISGAKPSSEYRMHLAIYNTRKDISAVVHTHPPHLSTLSCLKIRKIEPLLAEFILYFDNLRFLPYRTPGSEDLARLVALNLKDVNAIVLKNHGLVTFAENLKKAVALSEEAEHFAKVYIMAKILGNIEPLKKSEVLKLRPLRKKIF